MSNIETYSSIRSRTMSMMHDYYINKTTECIILYAFISWNPELVFTFNVQHSDLIVSFIFDMKILKLFYYEII